MKALLIPLYVLGGLLFLLLLLLLLGKVKIRIVWREKVKVTASVLGIRFCLYPDKKDEKKKTRDLSKCRNPDAVLRKELRRQKKEAAKALKKQRRKEAKAARKQKEKEAKRAGLKPTPNLKENLDMIGALLKRLYETTRGKLTVRVRRLHLRVGSDNAADTAIRYALILQSVTLLTEWIGTHFVKIRKKRGSMTVEPDFLSDKCYANVDIVCSIRLCRALGIAVRMLSAYKKEKQTANKRARKRFAAQKKQAKKTA